MKFKRINDFFKLFIVTSAIISLISVSLTSCGGGGGGGGGGSAAGPTETTSEEAAEETVASTPAPVLSSNAEILSFVFTQSNNPAIATAIGENLDGNPATVDGVATVTVTYPFESLTTEDLKTLIPIIEVSAGASITPLSGEVQDFSTDVVYTVKAQDGTEKGWTVSVTQLAATERSITYDLDGGEMKVTAPNKYNVEQGIALPENGEIVKDNYYFTGWTDQSTGSAISSWGANQKNEDVRVRANWSPAPYIEGNRIFANGMNVAVKKNSSNKTMVYFRENNSISGNEIALSAINISDNYQDLTGYSLFAGGSGNINNINIPITDCNIIVEDGTLSNIYGYNGNGANLVGNVFIELNGGTVTNDVVGFNRKQSGQPASVAVKISGNPTIGNKTDKGVWLNSLTSQIVTINDSLSSANAEAITLIADHSHISEDTIVATFASGKAVAGKFKLLRDDTHAVVNVNAYGSNIITIGSFGLPDPANVTWIGNDEFTLGTGNVNSGGTIFSVFADGGFLTVTETNLPDANFDMGIPLDENFLEDGYDNTLYAGKKYRYIQFTSATGNITAENADTFLSKIHFHAIRKPNEEARVKVRINLETVPITGAGYTLNTDVFYLDGSFYKKSTKFDTGGKSWPEAYNEAKAQTFNGLQGYLMTITSDAENKFVYDKIFGENADPDQVGSWIGGTRITPRNGYDASTWGWNETLDKNGKATWGAGELNDCWAWACGPEAGKIFYTTARYPKDNQSYRAPGMYSSWSNPKDCALNGIEWYYNGSAGRGEADYEPNNKNKNFSEQKDNEYYTQYTGRYVWNDANEKGKGYSTSQGRWQIHYYIVEFTPYEATQYSPGQKADATALHAERVYSKN
ncbi:MAG: InlB B-repeat-containing protein [Spirochaetaceae bacterium]|nr:InlB B-repeat-containing protein [Spirochaetaceae bacterium]